MTVISLSMDLSSCVSVSSCFLTLSVYRTVQCYTILYDHYCLFCFVTALDRTTQESSLMSVWSTSTGRNSVLGAERGGAVLPPSHLPIHVHVAHTHLPNPDGHCFHKRFHDCQVGRLKTIPVRRTV